jgi:hypothetical protein
MSRAIDIKAQIWANRLREFEASSLSVAQFCKSTRCSIQSFYQWRRKLAGDKSSLSAAHSAFLQVQTKADCSIQIKLLSGVILIVPIEALDSLPQILDRIA